MDAWTVDSRNRRYDWRRSGRHHQLRVGEPVDPAAGFDRHRVAVGIDLGHPGVKSQVDATAAAELLGSDADQLLGITDHAGHEVRNAAHPPGSEPARLQDHDLEVRIDTAGGRRGRHSCRAASDHHQPFRHVPLLLVDRRREPTNVADVAPWLIRWRFGPRVVLSGRGDPGRGRPGITWRSQLRSHQTGGPAHAEHLVAHLKWSSKHVTLAVDRAITHVRELQGVDAIKHVVSDLDLLHVGGVWREHIDELDRLQILVHQATEFLVEYHGRPGRGPGLLCPWCHRPTSGHEADRSEFRPGGTIGQACLSAESVSHARQASWRLNLVSGSLRSKPVISLIRWRRYFKVDRWMNSRPDVSS